MAHERLTRMAGGMLRYRYDLDNQGDMGFDFHMLCEVGAPYQAWFRNEIARRGWDVDHAREIEKKPWVADFVVWPPMSEMDEFAGEND